MVAIGLAACEHRAPQSQRTDSRDPLHDSLDQLALSRAKVALQDAMETLKSGMTYNWEDGSSGSYGSITPLRTFRIKTGHFCREYREKVARGNAVVSASRIACRDTDGIWKVARR